MEEVVGEVSLDEYLRLCLYYAESLERYSHRGYPEYSVDISYVQSARRKVSDGWFKMSHSDKEKLRNSSWTLTSRVNQLKKEEGTYYKRFDPELVLYLACNHHLDPLSSVQYDRSVVPYHETHVAPQLSGVTSWEEVTAKDQVRNYVTIYFDILIEDKSSRPRKRKLRGQYAGRSGRYDFEATVYAPLDSGKTVPHLVVPSMETGEFPTFCDHHSRQFDSEVAPFEDLLRTLLDTRHKAGIVHPEYSGTVTVFTDRATCHSCTVVAMKFQHITGIPVDVRHGQLDDEKGYGGRQHSNFD